MRTCGFCECTASLTRVEVSNTSRGVSLVNCVRSEILNSTITANRGDGISIEDSSEVSITGSVVSDNWCDGISLVGDTPQLNVADCTISNNGWSGINGVLAWSGTVEVDNCTI